MKKLALLCVMFSAVIASAQPSYLGTDNQDVTVTNPVTVISTGGLTIGGTVQAVVTNPVTVVSTGGLNVSVINPVNVLSTSTLNVLNLGAPSLQSKNAVYASSDSMVTSGVLSLTGLADSISYQAKGGKCTFSVNGGNQFELFKDTADEDNFNYTLSNAAVTLVSKDGSSVCRVKIIGAN